MDEFDSLIASSVARLTENTGANRRETYQRLRARLTVELRRTNPSISDAETADAIRELDRAIARFEEKNGYRKHRHRLLLGLVAATVFTAIGVLVAFPSARDEIAWASAKFEGRLGAIMAYNRDWPHGRHSDEAAWTIVQVNNTEETLDAYLRDHPNGRFTAEAREALDSLAWRPADLSDTFVGLQSYLQRFPNGAHAAEARQRAEAMLRDEQRYFYVVEYGNAVQIEQFLANFPGHVREADARATLANLAPRDLFDLIQEGKIMAHGTGAGIESVSLTLQNTTPLWLTVLVPPGTFLVARDTSAQNMITTAAYTIRVGPQSDQALSIAAACANRPRDIPEGDDQFAIARTPPQADLARLMPALASAQAPYAVRQAAVWILSDDADYIDLGVLVQSANGYGGSRVILAPETARAMQIIDGAGIDITRRAIWRDRSEVLRQLPDGELKSWLAAR